MTAKGVKSGDLHDLCIGGLLVCLTVLVGGRTVMLADRGHNLPAAMATHAVHERMAVPVPASDLSIYLELHETRDFSVRPAPHSAHECRS